MNEKATLRKILASWRGKDFTKDEAKAFDITKLIGVACYLNIIHKPGVADPSKEYEVISSITPLPKGVKCPKAINKPFILSYDNWQKPLFDTLPDFITKRMLSSDEFQKIINPHETRIPEPDEILEPMNDLPF